MGRKSVEQNKNAKRKLDALYNVWQELLDDYRTYCGLVSFSKKRDAEYLEWRDS